MNENQPLDYIPKVIKDQDLYHSIQKRIPKTIKNSAKYFIDNYQVHLKIKYSDKPLNNEQLIEAEEDAKRIEREIIDYSKEIIEDHELVEIDDTRNDVNLWNSKLDEWKIENEDIPPTYLNTPFMWSECYMYRRLVSSVFKSKYFDDFDVFKETKQNGFIKIKSIATTIVELAFGISDRIKQKKSTCEEEFEHFLHFAVWSNHFDLSGLIFEKILSNFQLIDKEKKKKLICEFEFEELYEYFKFASSNQFQICFILDNAGYELLTDLCFVEMLYQTGLLNENSKIVFHCKSFSWFVSDTVDHDFVWLLDCMANEFESNVVKSMARKWSNLLKNKNWQLKTSSFWQTPYTFHDMKRLAPDLFDELSEYDLVVVCGDLNYRKLINDFIGDQYTKFEMALGNFKPTNILSLRTIKSRPLVGLKKSVKFDRPNWKSKDFSGVFWRADYASIQFYKKSC